MTKNATDNTDESVPDFPERCRREIIDLHQFFQDWLGGKLPKDRKTFARFTDAAAPSMMLVTTQGTLLNYDQLGDWIYNAHNSEPGFRLWVEAIENRGSFESVGLMVYEEWQDRAKGRNVRQSTALFEEWPQAPNGVRWLHVHETNMAGLP